jgi:hypothetical protein
LKEIPSPDAFKGSFLEPSMLVYKYNSTFFWSLMQTIKDNRKTTHFIRIIITLITKNQFLGLVVEYMLSTLKALDLIPSATKTVTKQIPLLI